jgi:arylsulfatase A-like enzyme
MKNTYLISLTLATSAFQIAVAQEKTNIIVILADDMGWGDAGCYGGEMIPTPNIDRLAKEGVRCTNGYVTAPISGPSRYGILTGAYQQRFGIQDNTDAWAEIPGITERIPSTQKLLHETLKQHRYKTAIFGKYNLPGYPKTTFDESYSLMHFGGDYFPDETGHYKGVNEPKAISDFKRILWGPERDGDEYLTDRIGRQAVEYISKNKSTPFFMFIAFNAPHSPMQAKKEHKSMYGHIKNEALQLYAAMLHSMDENIGKILRELDNQNLTQNTLIVFLSDNGPSLGYTVDWPKEWPKVLLGSAGNLSGHKSKLLEGGIRTPFILRWPEKIKAGAIYQHPVSSLDIYPTVCAAANVKITKATIIDGVNLLPFLNNKQKEVPHKELFWFANEDGAVRSGFWKLIVNKNMISLYNLESDEAEKNNLSEKEVAVKEELLAAWNKFRNEMPAPCNQSQRKR